MSTLEREYLSIVLKDLSDVYGKPPVSPAVVVRWARDLTDCTSEQFRWAIDRHRKSPNGRFFPQPADLLNLIEEAIRPGSRTAWSIAVRAVREADPVITTEEILAAWYGTAKAAYDMEDFVGARLGFEDAYGRIIREKGVRPPILIFSYGWEGMCRRAVSEAVESGLVGYGHPEARRMFDIGHRRCVPPTSIPRNTGRRALLARILRDGVDLDQISGASAVDLSSRYIVHRPSGVEAKVLGAGANKQLGIFEKGAEQQES